MGSTQYLSGGHSDSVYCVERKGHVLASGGESGDLCLWDMRVPQLTGTIRQPELSCSSICLPKLQDHTLYAVFGDTVHQYDTRNLVEPVSLFSPSDDEINQIVLNSKEEYLAACDDSGNIKVFTIRQSENKVFKTLRNKHTNICSTVTFLPGKPWDLLSGGFDCQLIHWDFAKLKTLNLFNMQELLNDGNIDSINYMLNPPFVHHMDASSNGKLLGCGLGNGSVLIFDSSRRHLKQKLCVQAHAQGVSQIHFVSDAMFVSGSNDQTILLWDLSDAEGESGDHTSSSAATSNGHASATPPNNISATGDSFIKHKIDHQFKINWLKPFIEGDSVTVAVADQRAGITLYTIP